MWKSSCVTVLAIITKRKHGRFQGKPMNTQHPILLTGQLDERDDDCACPDKAFLLTFDMDGKKQKQTAPARMGIWA
jgi:hypothetical protein